MLTDLLRPFGYLTIKHPSSMPKHVNWTLPSVLVALAIALALHCNLQVNLFGTDGLIDRLLSFVQTLTGFYIAALAAVSSFNSPHLDRTMPGTAPTMKIKYNGKPQVINLTRRRFVTSMFAYLTAISFLFSLSAIAVLSIGSALTMLEPQTINVLKFLSVSWFLFLITQMTCITFWGLFYLGERILTPD